MILFLNFAPFSFGGGAEKWLVSVATALSKTEFVQMMDVSPKISNIYGRIVLRRKFDARISIANTKSLEFSTITPSALIPFSPSYRDVQLQLLKARVIYAKFDFMEVFLLLVFGGTRVLNKTVFGIHSAFLYSSSTLNMFERLHNLVFKSRLVRYPLSKSKAIHVLNEDQEKHLQAQLRLARVVQIPNFIESKPTLKIPELKSKLIIVFVGELNERKGAGKLLDIIDQSSNHFQFLVIGDGPLKPHFERSNRGNMKYLGYLDSKQIDQVLSEADVFILPSAAESFPLSLLEALSHGLAVVGSPTLEIKLISNYVSVNEDQSIKGYLRILNRIWMQKKSGNLSTSRRKTWSEINALLTKDKIIKELRQKLFI